MSLDVSLILPEVTNTGIFIQENGATRELTIDEWNAKFPTFGLLIQNRDPEWVYSENITHNLGEMAEAAGIYHALWRPEEIRITTAYQLIEPLEYGLNKLRDNPTYYRKYNAPNGWGKYEHLVEFVEKYLAACKRYPTATIRVSR